MADVKWIKIVTDVFEDEKLLLIDALPENDAILVIWFKILCLAGKQNNGGVFLLNDKIPYTDEMLSTIFRRPVSIVRLALKTFEQFGMIEIINDAITIPNWDKHQSLDKLEQARAKTRKRVAKHREKQKLLAEGNATCNADVTQCNATDKNREEKEKKRRDSEVEAEVIPAEAENSDNSGEQNPYEKLEPFRYNNVFLSDAQVDSLLKIMDIKVFDAYVDKIANYPNVKNCYETIKKWYIEDSKVK